MRWENRLCSDTILGRDLWNSTHWNCLRYGVYFAALEIHSLQYNSSVDSRNSSIIRRLLHQAGTIDNFQRPDTANSHIVVQHRDVTARSVRTNSRSSRFLSAWNRRSHQRSQNRRSESHDNDRHLTRSLSVRLEIQQATIHFFFNTRYIFGFILTLQYYHYCFIIFFYTEQIISYSN